MTYDYKCSFGHRFSVVKSIKDYEHGEVPCQYCEAMASREYFAPHSSVRRDFEAAFYPALGKVFESKKDLQYHLDKNGLVEVGNDFSSGQRMQDYYAEARHDRDEKIWESL